MVVTGGANGIGRALCLKFAKEGAKFIAVSDVDEANGKAVADEIGQGAAFFACDVSQEAQVNNLVESVSSAAGQVDIFCSNAGIAVSGGPEASDRDWKRSWEINALAHVYAARAVLPQMLARKEGYLLQTVSAAGLLTSLGSAPYAVTKHAALGFAEWLAITYGDHGIRVSALCPQSGHRRYPGRGQCAQAVVAHRPPGRDLGHPSLGCCIHHSVNCRACPEKSSRSTHRLLNDRWG